ncbi:hypothetical protein J4401_03430 [Candidatus Woesearchaeota archaeon]|nr:hypothetical protein [Candidatus Woesearchaeota archaeon]
MKLIQWMDSNARKMKWYDISLVKLTVFFTTLFLVTAFPVFRDFALGISWQIYLVIAIVLMLPLLKKMFF